MGNKVYIITQGEYSDYDIVTVIKDRRLADKFIKRFKGCRIEEYKCWDGKGKLKDIVESKHIYHVRMDKNGNVKYAEVLEMFDEYDDVEDLLKEGGIDYGFSDGFLNLETFADDEKHAVKIANEKRIQLIANNKWPVEKKENKQTFQDLVENHKKAQKGKDK